MAAKDKTRAAENARLASLERWSRVRDRTAATRPAYQGLRAKFDPGPDVPEPQRSKMIDAGIAAHMLRMRRARADKARATREAAAALMAAEIDAELAEAGADDT